MNAPPAEFALELRDVRKSFGKTEIIRGASLQVKPGERIAVIGPNGAGKSTLFNLISGRFGCSSGDIMLNGHVIDYPRGVRENNDAIEAGFSYTTSKRKIRFGFHSRVVVDGNNTDSKFWVGGSVDVPFGGKRAQ